MNDVLSQLDALVRQSELAPGEQDELISALGRLQDDWIAPVVAFIAERPEAVPSLYKNLKAKQAAIESDTDDAWAKVMADEDEWLSRLDETSEK